MSMYGPINFFEETEGTLFTDLTDEIIELFGIPCYFVPRNYIDVNNILGEDYLSTFTNKFLLKTFIKDINGFAGVGDLYTKFGFYSFDECTLEISKAKFFEITNIDKPNVGDIIFFEWTIPKTLFEINFVETENPFYHLGKVPKFELTLKHWQYSHETFTADTNMKSLIEDVQDNDDFMSDNDELETLGNSLIEEDI